MTKCRLCSQQVKNSLIVISACSAEIISKASNDISRNDPDNRTERSLFEFKKVAERNSSSLALIFGAVLLEFDAGHLSLTKSTIALLIIIL